MRIHILAIFLLLSVNVACSHQAEMTDIPIEQAIQIAKNYAASHKYSSFPRDQVPEFAKKELWFVYIYPKKHSFLGGDYSVLVDLHTGDVIAANEGM